jgi:hypothetical protein
MAIVGHTVFWYIPARTAASAALQEPQIARHDDAERARIRRLMVVAGADTGQSRCAAGVLLVRRIATPCGGFAPSDLRGGRTTIARQYADHDRLPGVASRRPDHRWAELRSRVSGRPPLFATARGPAAKTSATRRWPGEGFCRATHAVDPSVTRREFFGRGRWWLSRFAFFGISGFPASLVSL